METEMFEIVRNTVLVVVDERINVDDIRGDSLLVEDLGIDSLRFAKLSVALERALGIDEFPMQQWVDRCVENRKSLTLQSLVDECDALRR